MVLLYVLLVKLVFYLLPAAIPKKLQPRMCLFITYIIASLLEGAAVVLTIFAFFRDECEEADEACDSDKDWTWYYLAATLICALFVAFKIYFSYIIWRFYVELRDENVVLVEDGTEVHTVHIDTAPHPAFGDLRKTDKNRS